MVGDGPLLPVRQNGILLLISGDNHFNALLQILFRGKVPLVPNRPKRRFVYDIGQLRTGSTGGHPSDFLVIHIRRHFNLLGVNPQNRFSSLQIRKFHRYSPVKPSRSRQCWIQGIRTVGRRQNNDAVVSFESVHLRQQLIQGLLPLIVSANLAVSLFTDGIDLVDKNNARRLLLRLLEQIPNL